VPSRSRILERSAAEPEMTIRVVATRSYAQTGNWVASLFQIVSQKPCAAIAATSLNLGINCASRPLRHNQKELA
jgi:hypothetical protein